MNLLVIMFVAILLVTFGLVIALTRKTPQQIRVEQRMASIHLPRSRSSGPAAPEAGQLLKQTRTHRLLWLDTLLAWLPGGKTISRHITQANQSISPAALLLSSLGLFVAGYAISRPFASLLLVDLAVGLGLGLLPYGLIQYRRKKRIDDFNEVLAETIDMMARALRAGHSVLGAIETLAENAQQPAAAEFSEVFKQMNLGLPMREALMQLVDRVPSADLRVLVTAIMVQKETGGNLIEILDRTVFVIRERVRIEGEIQTQTAQGRMTGWILSGLPLIMLLLLNLINPGYSSVLMHDPLGRKLSYLSAGMLVAGAWTIRRIVNGIEV